MSTEQPSRTPHLFGFCENLDLIHLEYSTAGRILVIILSQLELSESLSVSASTILFGAVFLKHLQFNSDLSHPLQIKAAKLTITKLDQIY
ncbi:hypothetical protein L2E82_25594 [Cichorium intybus]|uniref:Uncharacterized protein n=1 Tax=Cichorium intybus TaxID=13427 RepID=A0ACB9E3M3_CICIN|nr:hypothetical protein L2E82_25594 [Cichorium intybus]